MGNFHTPLKYERTSGRRWGRKLYKLTEPFTYEIGRNGTGLHITAPTEYVTDFASIPFFLWWILPPNGKYGKACVIHDMCCEYWSNFSRIVGDAIFWEAMRSLRVPIYQRVTMYIGVRAYWLFWGKWTRLWAQK